MRTFTPFRMPALFALALSLTALPLLTPGAQAASVTSLFSTGVLADKTLSPTSKTSSPAVSVTDLHYQVRDASVNGSAFTAAYVSDPTQYPINNGVWAANTPKSEWLSPGPNPGTGFAADNFDYRTTFTLAGFNPSTFALNINFAADDSADIILNGTTLKTTQGNFKTFTALTFNAANDMTFRNALTGGVNTLDFLVHNSGSGPTGLQAQVDGIADVPEPGSVAMLVGISASGAGFFLRRRKK